MKALSAHADAVHQDVWRNNGLAPAFGQCSTLGSLYRSPKQYATLIKEKHPKRDANLENYGYLG